MIEILNKIDSPDDLKVLDNSQLNILCEEIRQTIISTVTGGTGHLASNLGVVELTVAIHRVFDIPEDKIIFDVGHQCYVHKLLTGRRDRFHTLRKENGLSGFSKRSESIYDCYGAGHSGTSLSAAIGIATAEKLKGSDRYTICLVGDGAYTGGSIHEALNNVDSDLKLIIILNENEMSISKNVGNMAHSLSRLRTSGKYLNFKHKAENVIEKLPFVGKPVASCIRNVKSFIKRVVYHTNYFEDLGILYMGPCDGNNLENCESVLREAKRKNKCCIIHAKTVKGQGYEPAINNPEKYHAYSAFRSTEKSFSSLICEKLCDLANTDEKICVTTAAMGAGTGVKTFGDKFPKRYFDVGIAEEHAVIFCAGLAADGMLPVFAVYSTFLQRTYDFLWHEFSLQKLPFVLLVDRAGFACQDGVTHHGIYDVPMLYGFDGTEIYTPAFDCDIPSMVENALYSPCISAIRYSKDCVPVFDENVYLKGEYMYIMKSREACKRVVVTYGRIFSEAGKYAVGDEFCTVIVLTKIKPFTHLTSFLSEKLDGVEKIVFLEESIKQGGAFMAFCEQNRGLLKNTPYSILAIEGELPEQGELCNLYEKCGISHKDIYSEFKSI